MAEITQANTTQSLNTVEVVDQTEQTLYFENDLEITERLQAVPGGTNLVDLKQATRLTTLSDALDYQPGVIVQEFFGGLDQPRINIRGSGIQGNPVSRGVLLRQNYLPLNEADGSFIIGLVNLRNSEMITVHRGANSRVPGSFTLGGDMNFIGYHGGGSRFGFEKGGFGQQSIQVSHGSQGDDNGANEDISWHLDFVDEHAEGYRHHSASRRQQANGSLALRLNDQVTNYSYLSLTDMRFEMPFVLPLEQAKQAPKSVFGDGIPMADFVYESLPPDVIATLPPLIPENLDTINAVVNRFMNVYKRDPHRDTQQRRLANRTVILQPQAEHNIGWYWQSVDDAFVDPFSHIETDSNTLGAQWLYDSNPLPYLHYQVGLDGNYSDMPRSYTANNPIDGSKLQAAYADLDMRAQNLALSLLFDLDLLTDLTLTGQVQLGQSKREAINRIGNDDAYDKTWEYQLPKLGVIYRPGNGDQRWFFNISKSIELPTFWEIVGIDINPVFNWQSSAIMQDIEPQKAISYEMGGEQAFSERLKWQITTYRSEIEKEIISTASQFGVIAESQNYQGDTVHQGVELGVNGHQNMEQSALLYRLSWTYSDFFFENGEFAGNRIAGVPENLIMAETLWQWRHFQHTLKLGPNVRWVPDDNPVDHENTLGQGSFAIFGFKASYDTHYDAGSIRAYLVLDNLTDENYNSTFVVRARSNEILPTFLPGNGFSASLGFQISF